MLKHLEMETEIIVAEFSMQHLLTLQLYAVFSGWENFQIFVGWERPLCMETKQALHLDLFPILLLCDRISYLSRGGIN